MNIPSFRASSIPSGTTVTWRRLARQVMHGTRACAMALMLTSPIAIAADDTPSALPRLVSAGGGVTEIVYALNAQSQLVAVDTSSTWPAAARSLPRIGYQRTLSTEGVLAMRPQVLLASPEAGPPNVLRQIEDAGVNVLRVDNDYRFEGLLTRVRQIAEASGQAEAGQRLAAQLSAEWQAVQTALRTQPPRNAKGQPPRVAFVMLHGAMGMIAGRETGADALLRHAGAVNAFGDAFTDYKPLSPESLVTAAPDFIIVTADGPDHAAALAALRALPGAALTDAVRNNRVAVIDVVLALGFGPRLPQAVQTLHLPLTQ